MQPSQPPPVLATATARGRPSHSHSGGHPHLFPAAPSSPYLQEDPRAPPVPPRPSPPPPYSSPSASPERPVARLTATEGPAAAAERTRERRPLPTPPVAIQRSQSGTAGTDQCWICYADSSTGEKLWSHCSCTLVAHPQCLLTWLSSSTTAPVCPVCSTPYTVLQPAPSSFLTLYREVVKRLDRASLALALLGAGGGVWTASAAYAVWVVRVWGGEEVARRVLWRDRWPLAYYLNLPLIPLTLILSRTPLLDSLLPFLPLSLLLPSPHTPTSPLTSLSFTYPPSPTLTLALLPWFRILYLRLRASLFRLVLERPAPMPGLAGLIATLAETDDFLRGPTEGERDRVEVVAEVEVVPDPVGAPAQRAENRLRVGLTRLTSLVVGALVFPALAGAVGGLLYHLALARKGDGLRRLLGLSLTSSSSRKALGDPVWVRATLGGGVVLVLRDCLELVAGVLEEKRKRARRVVGREVGDRGDTRRDSSREGWETSSGGRGVRVHTRL